MAAAIAHRGQDESGIWTDGPIGLACQLLRVTPESADEHQPVVDPETALVFDGRLNNRDELLPALGDSECSPSTPDATLVLAAWRNWGDGSLGRLNGDFALAILDRRARRLVLARDAVGCRPLYYRSSGRTLLFGSEIKAFAAHHEFDAKPNRDLLADLLLLEQLPYEDDGGTFFQGVQAVLPGHAVSITPSGITSRRFWDFDPGARVRYGSYDQYAEHLRELLMRAVSRRLRSAHPVAISFSGGLDSSVVLCAADDLRHTGRFDGPLLPMSYAPVADPATEENRFIRLIDETRQLRTERLDMGAPGNVTQLRNAAWHSETPIFDTGWCAEEQLLARARAQGARTVLTGLWSDQFLFVMGYLTDLFTTLRWREISGHLEEYRRWFVDVDAAYFRARFARELVLNLAPASIRSSVRQFRRVSGAPVRQPSLRLSGDLVTRAGRRRPPLRHPRYASAHARNIYQCVRSKFHRLLFETDDKTAARFGMERATPFLDRDVIAFLMAIPGDIQTHDGVPRAILRDAMRGIVPAPILARRWPEEGTTAASIEQAAIDAYLSLDTRLHASAQLGFCDDARVVDERSTELIGLEFWSRAFFSASLP